MVWRSRKLRPVRSPYDRLVRGHRGSEGWLAMPADGALPGRVWLYCDEWPAGMLDLDWEGSAIENFGILIEPNYRGLGLGSGLLQELITLAHNYRASVIRGIVRQADLDERPFLLQWYRRHGFTIEAASSVLIAAQLSMRLRN
jgi:GNAT superfamily N-acetyltransferase